MVDHSKRFVTVRPTLERMLEEEREQLKRKSIISQPEIDHHHHNFCCACSQRISIKDQITSKLSSISSINLSRVVAKESDYKNKLSEDYSEEDSEKEEEQIIEQKIKPSIR